MNRKDKSEREETSTASVMGMTPKTPKQILRFFINATITGGMALGSFWLLSKLSPFGDSQRAIGLWLMLAEAVSVLLSCVCNYLLNRRFTFRYSGNKYGLLLYVLYYAVTTPLAGLLIVWFVNKGLTPAVAKLIKMAINTVCDFLFCRFVVFKARKKSKTDKETQIACDVEQGQTAVEQADQNPTDQTTN